MDLMDGCRGGFWRCLLLLGVSLSISGEKGKGRAYPYR